LLRPPGLGGRRAVPTHNPSNSRAALPTFESGEATGRRGHSWTVESVEPLGAPEAAHAEYRALVPVRERLPERRAEDVMPVGDRYRLVTSRQRVLRFWRGAPVAEEAHGVTRNDMRRVEGSVHWLSRGRVIVSNQQGVSHR
jgi:hypothetical protein